MIYEYPEEFIVPFTYVDDLEEKKEYRNKKCKALNDDEINIFSENLKKDYITKILNDIDNDYADNEILSW